MKIRKNKYNILNSLLIMIVMMLSACSVKNDICETGILNPVADSSSNETSPTKVDIVPTKLATVSDDNETLDADMKDSISSSSLKAAPEKSNSANNDIINKDDDQIVSMNISKEDKPSTKKMIAIDAGHQGKGNSEKEPIGPGSKITKPKVSSGTQGVSSGVAEYKLNLVIAKKVKKELLARGYEVFMIRETHKVNLSNKERAEMANDSGADLFIRIHADSSTDSKVTGASTLYPSKKNPFVSHLSASSLALSEAIIDSICENTGAKNRGAIARDDMSGINWCDLPVTIIEMGYMSNKKEDKLMQTKAYQDKIVKGICDGIDKYYE